MPVYKAFPIRNFREGEVEVREPWLIPEDAFVTILNGYIREGVLRKRLGHSEFAQMVHFVDDESVADTGQSAAHTLANIPIRALKAGTVVITDSSGTPKVLTDDGNGTFTGDDNGSTIDYDTGVIAIEWDATPVAPIVVDYSFLPQLPIMGLANFADAVGTNELVVFDTLRAALWDATNSQLDDIPQTDRYSGTDKDFFHWTNWNGIMYLTNNKDFLDSYDGATLSLVTTTLDGTAFTLTCLLVFAHKDRLVCLLTTEDGTLFPQRARWTTPGGVSFDADESVDAPTSEFIIGAAFLEDDLIVFFERSIWFLKFSQDPNIPFKWERIDSFNGAFATNSVLPFSSQIDAVGATHIISTQGLPARIENAAKPDLLQQVNQGEFELIYAIYNTELELELISYPSIGSTLNDNMFVRNKFNGAWSSYDIGFYSFGKWIVDSDLTWNDVESTWDEIEFPWDADSTQAGFPIVLGGNSTGVVFKVNDTNTDDGAAINFSVLTGRLNPFVESGQRAILGYVDFLVTKDDTVTLDIDLYLDQSTTAYKTETITFDDDTPADGEKVWKRVYSGEVGDFHQIGLQKDVAEQTPIIHAMIPYFAPGGPGFVV